MANVSDYKAHLLQQVESASDPIDEGAESVMTLAASSDEIGEVIAKLVDPATTFEDQINAIASLHVIRNFSKVLPTHSADLTNALRGLIKSPDPEVRRQALSYLSISGDEIAQDQLQTELSSGLPESEKSVPTYQAIAMLSAHSKGIDKNLLMSIARNPPDEESLLQAVRHLPADAETISVLSEILQDETKSVAARALIPDIVGSVDPIGLTKIARRMLEEQGANTAIAPYLARGVATIQSEDLDPELEEAKSVIRSLAVEAPEAFKHAAELLERADTKK